VAFDAAGILYIADTGNQRIRKVAAGSGIISTVAGNGTVGFSGDGGPATAAALAAYPSGVALDTAGNLYIADGNNSRIRKVDGSGIITTVAGNGASGFSGDSGPATAASLDFPQGVALDTAGNLYIGDSNRIRKVATGSGIISTVAGHGTFTGFSGDGGPATAATLFGPQRVGLDVAGNLYIADYFNNRIRRVAAGSGIISTVAGIGPVGSNGSFSGDGGAATAAALAVPNGVALDASGNLYIADSGRVRAVFACVTLPAPNLQQPSNASSSVPTSPRLGWSPVKGAFHYDVYLDTANPPQKVVASDITTPTYSPANLEPLTPYYWKVVAKGDPFCTPFSTAASDVFSFTTTGTCAPPGPLSGVAALLFTPTANILVPIGTLMDVRTEHRHRVSHRHVCEHRGGDSGSTRGMDSADDARGRASKPVRHEGCQGKRIKGIASRGGSSEPGAITLQGPPC
jgi:sugar lactone lactonase YvrE